VCYIHDNTSLYLEIMRAILAGDNIGHGKNGYFLAASGDIVWDDLYSAMAKGLVNRGIVENDSVEDADEAALTNMGKALQCPKDFVGVQLSGMCTLRADHGSRIGWKPKYSAEHILEAADAELDLILRNL